jgi:6-pyruvoyltetrahydropterin/6-carboxytetrahydropterin synthase
MRVCLQRKRTFACAHRYLHEGRDEAWNRARFGDLTHVHGHNYTVQATVAGRLDDQTGIVVNLVDVKEWLAHAVEPFENRYVDAGSAVMEGRQPSTENLAILFWRRLSPCVAGTPAELARVEVRESDDLWSEYLGEDEVVYVTRMYDFSAAHRLHSEAISEERNREVFGKCNHPGGHGHNYVLEVTVKGSVDPETGFAFPLDRLDAQVDENVLQRMDHRNLNTDVPEFRGLNPTSENLAVVIWNALKPGVGEALHRVRVQETARNSFEYYGE